MRDIGGKRDEDMPLAASSDDTVAPMRLRDAPPRVTRLSRRVLAGIGLVAAIGVGGALIYALQMPQDGANNEELYSTENRSTADGLNKLPRDYTGPVLGPALPGDLGRPIVNAQEHGKPVIPPTLHTPAPDPEEQRRLAEKEAARTSEVFFQTGPARASTRSKPDTTEAKFGGQLSAAQNNVAFLNAPVDHRTVAADRVIAPASPFVLQAGSVIPAALITGIRSDLPGQVIAQVTENVYDSPTGRILLVPQGTRVIGEYDSGVGFGQRRVLLAWTRLIFPNGRSIVLERQPGADSQGYAGVEDAVDYHWGQLFTGAILSTILSIGAEAGSSYDEGRIVRALRQGAAGSINQTGRQIVQRQLDIAPTLTIRPGFRVRVLVTRDLVLEPYGERQW